MLPLLPPSYAAAAVTAADADAVAAVSPYAT